MTAFDKKVNQIAARHGWNISPVSGWYIPAYSIVPMDRKERDQITAALNRCKSFHVDVLQAFSACAWTCTILIRDRASEARIEGVQPQRRRQGCAMATADSRCQGMSAPA